ncbi:hypothetical protein [Actibacterium sp. 188UL27-1]|uniref:hypothetical protein n=1 Tax=Actibacterium sp. 188UL27-1 TaxID=2786961 RepID=UPI0019592DAE|nr:hypothetical protein [Actibacterium sp. 188UL27-1]MBM7069231.1 hypothetical protein [Actibacterium sp. 188UL27-1]
MAKLIYVVGRNALGKDTVGRLEAVADALTPDHIASTSQTLVQVEGKLGLAISGFSPLVTVQARNVLLGLVLDAAKDNWSTAEHAAIDGNYAIFRDFPEAFELLSDCVASRTIWYYFDDDVLIASTSQRAIVKYLGNFVFDARVIPWVLSSGSLGPELSWDARVKKVPNNTRLSLDKSGWRLSRDTRKTPFRLNDANPSDQKDALRKQIACSIKDLAALDFERWALSLSGGYDSRSILLFLHQTIGVPTSLKAITYVMRGRAEEEGTDGKLAQALARLFGIEHQYLEKDTAAMPVARLIDRFLFCGEGRIDHFRGYLDGMESWRDLHNSATQGLIRGDMGFGQRHVRTEREVRGTVGSLLAADFRNVPRILGKHATAGQVLSQELGRQPDETLQTWRDRLMHHFRLSSVTAALADVKYPYLEQISPLLSEKILTVVRTLPDNARANKALFRQIVAEFDVDIPVASKGTGQSLRRLLRQPEFHTYLRQQLAQPYVETALGADLTKAILSEFRAGKGFGRLLSLWGLQGMVYSALDLFSAQGRARLRSPRLDGHILAFRAIVVAKMHRNLSNDDFSF